VGHSDVSLSDIRNRGGEASLAERRLHYSIFQPAFQDPPLGAPLTTTHRVISYTYPSTLPFDLAQDELRTGDSLYRLTGAEYTTGEFYEYAYDAVGNRLSLTTGGGVVNCQYDAANRLTTQSCFLRFCDLSVNNI
jgi:YD repeat-containing protein